MEILSYESFEHHYLSSLEDKVIPLINMEGKTLGELEIHNILEVDCSNLSFSEDILNILYYSETVIYRLNSSDNIINAMDDKNETEVATKKQEDTAKADDDKCVLTPKRKNIKSYDKSTSKRVKFN